MKFWQEQTWGLMIHSVVSCVLLLTGFQTTASSVPRLWSPGTTVQSGPLSETQLARI